MLDNSWNRERSRSTANSRELEKTSQILETQVRSLSIMDGDLWSLIPLHLGLLGNDLKATVQTYLYILSVYCSLLESVISQIPGECAYRVVATE